MLIGMLVALVGAALVIAGGVAAPWFVPNKVTEVINAVDLVWGQGAVGAAGVGALFAILAVVFHRKMLAAVTLAGGVLILLAQMVVYLFIYPLLEGAGLDSHLLASDLEVGRGFYLMLGGALLLIVGGFEAVGAVKTWSNNARLLRVSVLWNGTPVRSEVFTEPHSLEVGRDAHDGMVVPTDAIPPRFKMFKSHSLKGDYDLSLTDKLTGTFNVGGKTLSVAEAFAQGTPSGDGAKTIRVSGTDYGKLEFGDITLVWQLINPVLPTGLGRWRMDLWVPAGMSIAILGLLGSVYYMTKSYDHQCVECDYKKQERKAMKVDANLLEKKEEEKKPEDDSPKDDDTTAKKAEGDEGKFGDPDEDPKKISKVPNRDGKLVSKIDPKKVGLVDILSSKMSTTGAIANILAKDTTGLQNKLAIAMAGAGSEFVMGHGSGGMGFKGTGTGGGGTDGYGRIHGLGKIDTGGGQGLHASLGQKRATKVAKLNIGSGESAGFCEKGDIAKNVRLRASAIRACYEQRLQVNNSLQGKITARWTIGLDGRVPNASLAGNTVSDASVGECVLRVIRRMAFKKPEGGQCIVQWPFVFNPGG